MRTEKVKVTWIAFILVIGMVSSIAMGADSMLEDRGINNETNNDTSSIEIDDEEKTEMDVKNEDTPLKGERDLESDTRYRKLNPLELTIPFERRPLEGEKESESTENTVRDFFETKETLDLQNNEHSLTGESGVIGGVVWSGTINVTYDVYVPEGETLIIEPGTDIYFNHTNQPTLYIGGTLEAEGTNIDEILFTSNATTTDDEPNTGDWGGIVFNSTSEDSMIEYANISYADIGVTFNQTSPPVTNCNITHNNIGVLGSEMNITSNNMTNNEFYGVVIDGFGSSDEIPDIDDITGPVHISDNYISENGGGINWESVDIYPTIHNNRILGNEGDGVTLISDGGNLSVEDEYFYGNIITGNEGNGVYGESTGNLTLVLTENSNIIEWNHEHGISMEVEGHASVELQCDILNNGYSGIHVLSDDEIDADIDSSNFSYNGWNDLGFALSGLYFESEGNMTLEVNNTVADENGYGDFGLGFYSYAVENSTANINDLETSRNDWFGTFIGAATNLNLEANNITANDNGYGDEGFGFYSYAGEDLTANINDLETSRNDYFGTLIETGANLNLEVNDIVANENDNVGIYAEAGENSTATLDTVETLSNEDTGTILLANTNLYLEASNIISNYNGGTAFFAEADDGHLESNIYNIEALENDDDGLGLYSGTIMIFNLWNSRITHNGGHGVTASSGTSSMGDHMEVEISDNNIQNNGGHGVELEANVVQTILHIENNDIHENSGDGLTAESFLFMYVDITSNYFGKNEGTGAHLEAGSQQTTLDGTIGGSTDAGNDFVKNGEDGLSILHGGDLSIGYNLMENNEDTGLRMIDSLYHEDIYDDGEIITLTARPNIFNNVVSNNGFTSHDQHPGLGMIDLDEYNGIYLEGSTAVITDNIIENNWNNGVALEDSGWTEDLYIEFEDNIVTKNYIGITSEESNIEIKNNEITYNRGSTTKEEGGGIYSLDGSTVNLVNNDISHNILYGVYTDEDSRTNWIVTHEAVAHSNSIVLRGDLEIDGGELYLEDINFENEAGEWKGLSLRNSVNDRFGISVTNDGVFEAQNTWILPYMGSDSFTFDVNNAYLNLENCIVVGQRSINLESSEFSILGTIFFEASYGGLELYDSHGDVTTAGFFDNSNFDINLEDSTISLNDVEFDESDVAIESLNSEFIIEDSEISAINEGIRATGNTEFEIHNSNFDTPLIPIYNDLRLKDNAVGHLFNVTGVTPERDIIVRDDARLEVYWNVRVRVMDVFWEPVENEAVYVQDMNETSIEETTTNWKGYTDEITLHTNTYYSDSEVDNSTYLFLTEQRRSIEVIDNYYVIELSPGIHPEFITTPPTNAVQNSEYFYNADAVDPNPPVEHERVNLVYSLVEKPEGMNINPSTGEITWTPDHTQIGSNEVTLRVQNSEGRYDEQTWTIHVENVNDPPIITSEAPSRAYRGVEYKYHVEAIDYDGDVLNYSLVQAPDGMEIDSEEGLITWTPTHNQVRNHTVIVEVFDGTARTRQEFVVRVSDPGIQTFLENPSVSRGVGTTEDNFVFTVIYSDLNGHSPENVYVVIDGEKHEMQRSVGEDYARGVTYEYETTLSIGTLNYHFLAITEDEDVVQSDKDVVTVDAREAPSLSHASVSKEAGTTEDTFTFTVTYSNKYGYEPEDVYVVIDGERHEMERALGEDYSRGVTYEYSTTLESGTFDYRFETITEDGDIQQTEKDTVEVSSVPLLTNLQIVLLFIIAILVALAVIYYITQKEPSEKEPGEEEMFTEETELDEETPIEEPMPEEPEETFEEETIPEEPPAPEEPMKDELDFEDDSNVEEVPEDDMEF